MARSRRLGQLGLIAVAIIWGNGFVASSLALAYFNPFQILAIRFTLAFVVLVVLNLKRLRTLKKPTVIKSAFLGVILYLAFMFQTIGLQFTTPSRNAFLTAVNVVIVPFLGLLIFRKKIPIKGLIGAIVSFLGIAFISLDTSKLTFLNRGDVLTLVCACFFALHIFFTDIFVKEDQAWAITLIQMGGAAACSLLMLVFNGGTMPSLSQQSLVPVLYLGLISTLVAYFLQTYSQMYTTSSEAAVILSTEAFFGMLGAVLLLNEVVNLQMIIGAILIFLGILIVELKPKAKKFSEGEERI